MRARAVLGDRLHGGDDRLRRPARNGERVDARLAVSEVDDVDRLAAVGQQPEQVLGEHALGIQDDQRSCGRQLRRAPSTEHRAPSAERRAQHDRCPASPWPTRAVRGSRTCRRRADRGGCRRRVREHVMHRRRAGSTAAQGPAGSGCAARAPHRTARKTAESSASTRGRGCYSARSTTTRSPSRTTDPQHSVSSLSTACKPLTRCQRGRQSTNGSRHMTSAARSTDGAARSEVSFAC